MALQTVKCPPHTIMHCGPWPTPAARYRLVGEQKAREKGKLALITLENIKGRGHFALGEGASQIVPFAGMEPWRPYKGRPCRVLTHSLSIHSFLL